jgi:putative hemolysin
MHATDLGRAIAPITAGPFEARLAQNAAELRKAQELRYQVLFESAGGSPDKARTDLAADVDPRDEFASHIVVLNTQDGASEVVGTLRLVSSLDLAKGRSFYTEDYFDLSKLRSKYSHVLELGRFCVDPATRGGIVLGLIWKVASAYILQQKVDLMFGCASFPGADIQLHRKALTFLLENGLAPESLRVPAIVPHHTLEDLRLAEDEPRSALRDMPPLVRGYLKMGAKSNAHAIVDPEFNTTFVCIYVDAANFAVASTPLAPR